MSTTTTYTGSYTTNPYNDDSIDYSHYTDDSYDEIIPYESDGEESLSSSSYYTPRPQTPLTTPPSASKQSTNEFEGVINLKQNSNQEQLKIDLLQSKSKPQSIIAYDIIEQSSFRVTSPKSPQSIIEYNVIEQSSIRVTSSTSPKSSKSAQYLSPKSTNSIQFKYKKCHKSKKKKSKNKQKKIKKDRKAKQHRKFFWIWSVFDCTCFPHYDTNKSSSDKYKENVCLKMKKTKQPLMMS